MANPRTWPEILSNLGKCSNNNIKNSNFSQIIVISVRFMKGKGEQKKNSQNYQKWLRAFSGIIFECFSEKWSRTVFFYSASHLMKLSEMYAEMRVFCWIWKGVPGDEGGNRDNYF